MRAAVYLVVFSRAERTNINMLLDRAKPANSHVTSGVTIIRGCRYRREGTRNQRLPHNDQTQITAVSLSLIKNQLVRTGAQRAQRLRKKRIKKREQPRRVCTRVVFCGVE